MGDEDLQYLWQRTLDGGWIWFMCGLGLAAIMACYDAGRWSPIWRSWEETERRGGRKDG